MRGKSVFDVLGNETSVSDLKGVSELLLKNEEVNRFHLALIRDKNYALIGEKQFTFFNNTGVADLLEKIGEGVFSRDEVLLELSEKIGSLEETQYFDHKRFSREIRDYVEMQ